MVKITVIKKNRFDELISQYAGDIIDVCSYFSEGQEFYCDGLDDVPHGFCAWAWADIQRDVAMITFGAHPEPVLKAPRSIISCCTEGLRPVVFKIEYIDSCIAY